MSTSLSSKEYLPLHALDAADSDRYYELTDVILPLHQPIQDNLEQLLHVLRLLLFFRPSLCPNCILSPPSWPTITVGRADICGPPKTWNQAKFNAPSGRRTYPKFEKLVALLNGFSAAAPLKEKSSHLMGR
ncbi:hypothetical protein C356_06359 [Cryptococcus neoformans c45]|nr:hypothetical protein C356_06359 [Cryptococcus neoformans var. grubii c45]